MLYYYLTPEKKHCGPLSLAELCAKAESGQLPPAGLVAKAGDAAWRPLSEVAAEQGIKCKAVPVAGSCPGCGQSIGLLPDGMLPLACPHCGHAFRPFEGREQNLWYNFTLAFRQYAKFTGRATRMEFWSFMLIFHIALFVFPLAELIMLLPALAVTVRRLHDVGWSGKWVLAVVLCNLFAVVGLVGALSSLNDEYREFADFFTDAAVNGVALFVLSFLAVVAIGVLIFVLTLCDSQHGANQYGPSRKYPLV